MVFTRKISKNIFGFFPYCGHKHMAVVCSEERNQFAAKGGIIMTANQIAYARHKEDVRHNTQSEKIERRKAQAASQSARAALSQADAAQQTATTNWWKVREEGRHNVESESIQRLQTENTQRHNVVLGEAALRQAAVAERDSATREVTAAASSTQAEAARRQAEVAAINATTRQSELAASIAMNRAQVGLGYSQLSESARHAKQTEAISQFSATEQVGETARHNLAMESVAREQASADTSRAQSAHVQAAAATSQADTARKNATSQRITAISGAVANTARAIRDVGWVALR